MQSLQSNNIIKQRVAIIGSRYFGEHSPRGWNDIVEFVKTLPAGTMVVSGDGYGVDKLAVSAARTLRTGEVTTLEFTPEAEIAAAKKEGKTISFGQACARRNWKIVDACDSLVAFWTASKLASGEWSGSPGTAMTIGFALKMGKPVQVFAADGTEMDQDDIRAAAIAIARKQKDKQHPMPEVIIKPEDTGMFDSADLAGTGKVQSISARERAMQNLRQLDGFRKVGASK